MEFAWRRDGGWENFAVDGEGAGDFNQVAFDAENQPVILYSNPVEQQSATNSVFDHPLHGWGESWEKTRLFEGNVERGIFGSPSSTLKMGVHTSRMDRGDGVFRMGLTALGDTLRGGRAPLDRHR